MKTSSIRYRVADFLKQHPPFQCMDEADLLGLVRDGRVRVHEGGEIVVEQGRDRGQYIVVVQQGAVRLVDESNGGSVLRDLLGEGDLLGVGAFLGKSTYLYSAVTEGDTILYALPIEEFRTRAAGYPEVARFLAAYFSVRPHYSATTAEGGRNDPERGSLAWLEDVDTNRLGADTPTASSLATTPAMMWRPSTRRTNDTSASSWPTALCDLFAVRPHDRHTASGDAFITAQIFLKLLKLGRRLGRDTLGALSEPFPIDGDPAGPAPR